MLFPFGSPALLLDELQRRRQAMRHAKAGHAFVLPLEADHETSGPYLSFVTDSGSFALEITGDDHEEHAAQIVRAVNAHDGLVKQLAHLVRLIEPQERDGSMNIPGLATLNAARAALAKAEAKS